MSEQMDPATVLDEAADLLLIRGVNRTGTYGNEGGPRCALGAIAEVTGTKIGTLAMPASLALHHTVRRATGMCVAKWNDGSADDFEVIDMLRRTAKDIRNGDINPALWDES